MYPCISLQDVILKSIVHPVVRLVSSTRLSFPSGHRGRYTLVTKLIDTMYLISLRIGAEMTKVHLAVPSLQRFFLAFDKAHGVTSRAAAAEDRKMCADFGNSPLRLVTSTAPSPTKIKTRLFVSHYLQKIRLKCGKKNLIVFSITSRIKINYMLQVRRRQ